MNYICYWSLALLPLYSLAMQQDDEKRKIQLKSLHRFAKAIRQSNSRISRI